MYMSVLPANGVEDAVAEESYKDTVGRKKINKLLVLFCAGFTIFVGAFLFINLCLIYSFGDVHITEPSEPILVFEIVGAIISVLIGLYVFIGRIYAL